MWCTWPSTQSDLSEADVPDESKRWFVTPRTGTDQHAVVERGRPVEVHGWWRSGDDRVDADPGLELDAGLRPVKAHRVDGVRGLLRVDHGAQRCLAADPLDVDRLRGDVEAMCKVLEQRCADVGAGGHAALADHGTGAEYRTLGRAGDEHRVEAEADRHRVPRARAVRRRRLERPDARALCGLVDGDVDGQAARDRGPQASRRASNCLG